GDVVLPVGVDEVMVWKEPSEIVGAWASDSAILSSAHDAVKAWPQVWPYVRAAKRAFAEHRDKILSFSRAGDAEHRDKSLLGFIIGFCPDVAAYQLGGANQKLRKVFFGPGRASDLRAWLEEKLGAPLKLLRYYLRRRHIGPMAGAGGLDVDDAKVTVLKRIRE